MEIHQILGLKASRTYEPIHCFLPSDPDYDKKKWRKRKDYIRFIAVGTVIVLRYTDILTMKV